MNAKIFVFLISLLVIVSVAHAYTAGECTDSNDPPSGGQWNVTNTTVCSNTTITLNGNFNITGNVTFQNVTLILNLTSNGRINITLESGGLFNITQNSNITSINQSYHYIFNVKNGSVFSITYSHLSDAGWISSGEDGFIINTTVSEFTRNTITRNRRGISLFSSYNNITNNTINNTDGSYGIHVGYGSNFNNISYNIIDDVLDCIDLESSNNTASFNTLLNSDVGVQFCLFSPQICTFNSVFNNTIRNHISSGIAMPGGSHNNTIYNNYINSSNNGILINGGKENRFYNNTIVENLLGFGINSANNKIYENIIKSNTGANIYINIAIMST
jgi:parallel beta-helix repeat protein